MTNERLNELINGPLSHPLPLMRLVRLAMALRAVVEASGLVGEEALEAHCRCRQFVDEGNDGK